MTLVSDFFLLFWANFTKINWLLYYFKPQYNQNETRLFIQNPEYATVWSFLNVFIHTIYFYIFLIMNIRDVSLLINVNFLWLKKYKYSSQASYGKYILRIL